MPSPGRKSDRLIAYLEEQIVCGRYPGGSRIPSLRELQQQFHLSYGTVLSGIDELCRRGLLQKHPRSGISVATATTPPACDGNPVVAVFTIRSDTFGLYPTVLCGIREETARRGVNLQLCQLPPGCLDRDLLERLSEGCAGVILLCELDASAGMLPRHRPCVGVMMDNSDLGRISTVDIDPFVAAELATGFFRRHNLKTVRAVMVSTGTYRRRFEIFAAAWRRAGGRCEPLDFAELRKAAERNPALWAELFPRGQGGWFASDNLLFDCAQALRKATNRTLEEECVVLGLDGKRLLHPDFPVFPTISVDWRTVGARALEECHARIMTPGRLPERIYLPGELQETQSAEKQ